jgi:hypothetical protein
MNGIFVETVENKVRNMILYIIFEVQTQVKISVCVVTPCGLVGWYQRFGGTYCLHPTQMTSFVIRNTLVLFEITGRREAIPFRMFCYFRAKLYAVSSLYTKRYVEQISWGKGRVHFRFISNIRYLSPTACATRCLFLHVLLSLSLFCSGSLI